MGHSRLFAEEFAPPIRFIEPFKQFDSRFATTIPAIYNAVSSYVLAIQQILLITPIQYNYGY